VASTATLREPDRLAVWPVCVTWPGSREAQAPPKGTWRDFTERVQACRSGRVFPSRVPVLTCANGGPPGPACQPVAAVVLDPVGAAGT